eukprot:NODE_536_length_6333_cov_0.998877.p2 type:complete len:400 gc:universal NODE_536_length_6333_cov_0.998877:2360-3559(+)
MKIPALLLLCVLARPVPKPNSLSSLLVPTNTEETREPNGLVTNETSGETNNEGSIGISEKDDGKAVESNGTGGQIGENTDQLSDKSTDQGNNAQQQPNPQNNSQQNDGQIDNVSQNLIDTQSASAADTEQTNGIQGGLVDNNSDKDSAGADSSAAVTEETNGIQGGLVNNNSDKDSAGADSSAAVTEQTSGIQGGIVDNNNDKDVVGNGNSLDSTDKTVINGNNTSKLINDGQQISQESQSDSEPQVQGESNNLDSADTGKEANTNNALGEQIQGKDSNTESDSQDGAEAVTGPGANLVGKDLNTQPPNNPIQGDQSNQDPQTQKPTNPVQGVVPADGTHKIPQQAATPGAESVSNGIAYAVLPNGESVPVAVAKGELNLTGGQANATTTDANHGSNPQ